MAHALDGIGFIPHTVFWVDFLARENGLESAMPLFVVGSSLLWVGMLLVLASHRYAANRLAGSP
jgi:hypothetical protein